MDASSLKKIYEASPSASLVLLPDFPRYTIVNTNWAYCQATNSRTCDLINKGLFEAFPDNPNDPEADGVEKLRASLELVVATKASHKMDTQKYDIPVPGTKGFEVKYWSPENTPVLNYLGEVAFIIHTVVDITEKIQAEEQRKKAENLIRVSEAKYRAFFENSMDGILLTVTDGQILAANPAACEIFKMTEKEICDAGRFGIVDMKDPRLKQLLEERRLKGKAIGEVTLVRKDGSKFPSELSSSVFEETPGMSKTSMIIRDITGRKAAEREITITSKELQKALSDLSKIMESSLDVICTIDQAGRFIKVSAAAEKMWGYLPHELIGKQYINFVSAEDYESTRSATAEIMSGREMTNFQNYIIRKDGSKTPNVWSMKWNDTEKIMYCVAKDITDKKGLEKAYEVEKQRFLDLYSQAPSCMGILKGPNHVYELANPLYLKLIDKKDIIGKTVLEVLPELQDQGIFELLDRVYQTGETFSANEMLMKFDFNGDGILVDTYLNFIYQAHRNGEGEIDGILFFVVDVTEQVLSRQKIELSEKRFKTLIQEGSDLISIIDKDKNYRYLSPAFTTILRIEYSELIGTSPFGRIHKDDVENVAKTTARLLTEKRVQYAPFRYRVGCDEYRWLETIATNLLDDPTIQGVLLNSNDITDQMNYIQAIEDQNTKLKEIAWIQSHLVRAPVVRILALIDLLRDDKDAVEQPEILSYIYESTRELDLLIKDIVDKAQKIDL
ncbi:MAG: PAS domain S-box protein [Daejeonella sp.]|uniref:PAS domain S-box protein n=1 Tax=Daejeonella sp. TaxID=2805397 RepID=UPI003C77A33E